MNRIVWIALLIGVAAQAAETGPLLYSGETPVVSGYFEGDKGAKINLEPKAGVYCRYSIQKITYHHAGNEFSGWHFEFKFEHPELEEKIHEEMDDFFWNEQELGSVFTKGFQSNYEYLSPVYDPPYRQEIFESGGSTTFKVTGFGGFVWTSYVLTPASDGKTLNQFEVVVEAMGRERKRFTCVGGATK